MNLGKIYRACRTAYSIETNSFLGSLLIVPLVAVGFATLGFPVVAAIYAICSTVGLSALMGYRSGNFTARSRKIGDHYYTGRPRDLAMLEGAEARVREIGYATHLKREPTSPWMQKYIADAFDAASRIRCSTKGQKTFDFITHDVVTHSPIKLGSVPLQQ